MKFKVGDKVRRLPQYQDAGGWRRGGEVMVVRGLDRRGWMLLDGCGSAQVLARRFQLVGFSGLARDRLYADLREHGASHAAALDFLKAAPTAASILSAYTNSASPGETFARLVVWWGLPQGHGYWYDLAKRAGWQA